MYVLEEKFTKIHLPNWQFYLPGAIGQWDISSPRSAKEISPEY